MKLLYRIALFTGLIPIIGGLLLFLTWLTNRASWFESISQIYLFALAGFVGAGLVALAIYYLKSRQFSNRVYLKSPLLPLFLLIVNFPLAFILYNSAVYIKSTSIIVIENNSDFVIKKMYLSNGGKNYFIEPVEPNDRLVKALNFKTSGLVHYSFEIDNREVHGTMFRHLEVGSGGKSNMKISRIGNVIISENI